MKKNIKKIMSLILSGLVSFSALTTFANGDVVDEKWGKPVFVYGSGLNSSEIKKTEELLEIKNEDSVNVKMVDGQDELRYLANGAGDSSAMISSVLVQKKDKGKGVTVIIKTPKNITQINENQYRNAAITAGIADAEIKVASVKKVTGESALTGIYKAFEANGQVLDQKRMQVAQNELEVTNQIVQENKENKSFDPEKLNQIILDVKEELTKYYQENGKTADGQEVENFVRNSVEKYDLASVISSDQVSKLVSLFRQYQETGAVNSEEVVEQLKILSKDLGYRAQKIYQDAKDSGMLDKIVKYIMGAIDRVLKIFNK